MRLFFFSACYSFECVKLARGNTDVLLEQPQSISPVTIEKKNNCHRANFFLARCLNGSNEEVLSLLARARWCRSSHQSVTQTAASQNAELPDGAAHCRPSVYKPHVIKTECLLLQRTRSVTQSLMVFVKRNRNQPEHVHTFNTWFSIIIILWPEYSGLAWISWPGRPCWTNMSANKGQRLDDLDVCCRMTVWLTAHLYLSDAIDDNCYMFIYILWWHVLQLNFWCQN